MYQTVWEHISIIVLFFLSLLAVFSFNQSQTETAVQAASLPVWIDYDIHERDVIQVKLFDDLPIRAQNGRLTLANTRQPDRVAIAVALNELPDGRWQPIFDQPEAKLSQWRQHGVARTGQPLPDLNLYFQVRLPDGVEATDALAQFRASPLVQGAYPVSKPVAPPLPPDYISSNDGNFDANFGLNIYQRYLDAAPAGMDVRYAWEGSGGRGGGIGVCDVEYGYKSHADLPAVVNIKTPVNIYPQSYYEHGTAVLGM